MNYYPKYPRTTQTITLGAASVAMTNAVGANIHCVRVIATQPALIAIDQTPTATTTSVYLAANREEYFTIHPGEKVAGLQGGTGGTLYVTEMSQ